MAVWATHRGAHVAGVLLFLCLILHPVTNASAPFGVAERAEVLRTDRGRSLPARDPTDDPPAVSRGRDSLSTPKDGVRNAAPALGATSSIGLTVCVVPNPASSYRFALERNAPNPFASTTAICWSTAEPGDVSLRIYNIKGEEVVRLVEGRWPPGRHRVLWNGTDLSGRRVPSGVYLYRLIAGPKQETHKLLVIR